MRIAKLVSADGLTGRERAFCLGYIANGFKASAAYKAVAPAATARSESSQWLTKPHVRRFLDAQMSDYFSRLQMAGAEALGRIAQDAKADIRELFDEHGSPLPPHLSPDSIANSIEACEVRADGSVRVKLVSKLAARRLILEATGALKDSAREGVSALARAIRGDLGLPEPGNRRRSLIGRVSRPAPVLVPRHGPDVGFCKVASERTGLVLSTRASGRQEDGPQDGGGKTAKKR